MEQPSNQYEQERRQKMQRLRELGVDPFGGRVEGVQALASIRELHKPEFGQDGGPVVIPAGRLVFIRDMGKLQFVRLRDETGELQVALDKKRLSEADWNVAKLLDLGDQIVVEGPLGQTKTGEITVWAKSLAISSKSLLPPPDKFSGLSDVELRYRQRYVDLFTNPDVMRTLKLRSAVVAEIRRYMSDRGYTEVETPMMQPIPGGAAARPFITHHRALDIDLYLRIAPELYLKRLLVGGFNKVFELNRNFRNEGISPRHNPEFTMLEAYEAYGSWETMADLVEGMICHLAEKLFGGLKIEHKNAEGVVTKTINLQRPWRRVSMVEIVRKEAEWVFGHRDVRDSSPNTVFQLILHHMGTQAQRMQTAHVNLEAALEAAKRTLSEPTNAPTTVSRSEIRDATEAIKSLTEEAPPQPWAAASRSFTICEPYLTDPSWRGQEAETFFRTAASVIDKALDQMSPAEQLVFVYEKLVEPELIDPTFVTRVPSVIIPLARKCKDDDFFADVYELAINGQEISPGYTELNDPDVQAENFKHQVGDKEEQQKMDEDFLTALSYGMPPAGGMGLGIDRLVMMLTGAESIRDVILFPLMRPQE